MKGNVSYGVKLFSLGGALALAGLVGIGPRETRAQVATARIEGTVTDATGAIIPNAKVTANDGARNLTYSTTTDAGGLYAFPTLPVSTYTVRAEAQGFATKEITDTLLQVNRTVQVNIELQVGQVLQQVEVTAAALQVEASTSAIGTVVDNRKIVDLPLNGRTYLQLALLTPATVPPAQGDLISTFHPTNQTLGSINGGRVSSNFYLLDGVDVTDPSLDTPALNPSIDFLQEFKIMTNSFSAELGRNNAVVNAITKSGANEFHGNVYEFIRNNVLDARNFFDRSEVPPFKRNPPYKQNQFGFTVGGPVSIPRVYTGRDRTFFFGAYEGLRIRQGNTFLGNFPTPQELAGDLSSFPEPIRDAFTGAMFPNNQVPVDPKAATLATYFPAPNAPGFLPGVNYVASPSTSDTIDQISGRIDHRFVRQDSFFARYSFSHQDRHSPGVAPLSGTILSNRGQSLALAETHTFSSTLLNEFRFGFTRSRFVTNAEGAEKENVAGSLFANVGAEPIQWGLPILTIQGFTGLGSLAAAYSPLEYNTNIFQFINHTTKVWRGHTLKAGLDIEHMVLHPRVDQLSRGNFTFNGQITGNSLADFLLGVPFTTQAGPLSSRANFRGNWWAFFLQDDWKVHPRLTLNLGLRYEYYQPFVEENDQMTYVGFSNGGELTSPSASAVARFPTLLKPAPTRGLWFPDKNNWAPRFGFAYRPFKNNRTAVRGGFGIFYDLPEQNENLLPRLNPPFYFNTFLANDPANPVHTFQNLFPAPVFVATSIKAVIPLAFDQNDRQPYVAQWNLNLQRELLPNLLFEVGYLGAKGTKLLQRVNVNQTRLTGDGNFFNNIGLVPYPNLNPILVFISQHATNSNFQALTVKVEKRYAQGLMLLASYTWSKALDYISGSNGTAGNSPFIMYVHNLRLDRGVSEFDQTQRLSLSYSWDIPVGRGKHFLGNLGGAGGKLLGGWQVTGITTFSSGTPFTVGFPVNTSGTSLVNPMRPDLIAEPSLPVGQRSPARWFNTSAFATPTPGRFGTAGRNILRGDGTANFDVGFLKATSISDRVAVQFRAELFNAFNTPQFNFPGRIFGTPSFGVVTSAGAPRIIQFGLKVSF